uniref:uncharacterized protein LOC101292714 n=1 Tax=Fragaria vesca subsp. vesca TaxID=101020 RepID=UPI0005C8B668|nr:PREDICTED: uncharacterized protein LOC101292714 [Fragaria vesca subsp. vesca]
MGDNGNFPTLSLHDVSGGVLEESGIYDVDYTKYTNDESYENEDNNEIEEDPDDRDFWIDEHYVHNVEEDLKQFEKIVVDERPYDHHVEFGEDSSDYEGSDDLGSVDSSSSDDETQVRRLKRNTPKFKTYRREIDLRRPQITLGLEFPSMKECREAIREYAICIGKALTFAKNFPHRVKENVKCCCSKMPIRIVCRFCGEKRSYCEGKRICTRTFVWKNHQQLVCLFYLVSF